MIKTQGKFLPIGKLKLFPFYIEIKNNKQVLRNDTLRLYRDLELKKSHNFTAFVNHDLITLLLDFYEIRVKFDVLNEIINQLNSNIVDIFIINQVFIELKTKINPYLKFSNYNHIYNLDFQIKSKDINYGIFRFIRHRKDNFSSSKSYYFFELEKIDVIGKQNHD